MVDQKQQKQRLSYEGRTSLAQERRAPACVNPAPAPVDTVVRFPDGCALHPATSPYISATSPVSGSARLLDRSVPRMTGGSWQDQRAGRG